MPNKLRCGKCNNLATWIRHTQFTGSHAFCTFHAQKEENFGESYSSYFFWEKISAHDKRTK